MTTQRERPGVAARGVEGESVCLNPTVPGDGDAGPTAAVSPVPIRDKLLWGWDDIAALTGLSRRLLEREVSAGRMPAPDVRIGRRACFRAATITGWIDELADHQGRRSRT